MTSPLVSIIIPTFNRCTLVQEAIDSVLAQTCRSFELIVVDDGSTDDTPEMLKSYGNALQIIRQSNQGVSAARNRGIALSTGRYIALLDSDDLWLPQKLAIQVDFFQSRSNTLICQTDEVWIRNGIRVNPGKRHQKPSGMIFEPSLALCLVSPSAVMMDRILFERVGLFNETFPACEDYDLWLRIGCRHQIHLIPDKLVIKRGGHDDQLSRLPLLDSYRIQSILDIMNSGHLDAAQNYAAASMLIQKCRIYADGCRKRGRLEEAAYYNSLIERASGGIFKQALSHDYPADRMEEI
ncbi:MAG: glycosyltransferase [Desulfatirhabdiaceae bacterium]